MEDYPLLVSGDVEGNVEFWLTKPWLPSPGDESVPWNRNEVVHCITPQKGYAVPVSSLRVIAAETICLVVGDEIGRIFVYDLSTLIASLKIRPIVGSRSPTTKEITTREGGYAGFTKSQKETRRRRKRNEIR